MNQVIVDILPYLLSGLFAAIGWQFKEAYHLKTKVEVLEKDVDNLQESIDKDRESIYKTINNLQESVEKDKDSIDKDIESLQESVEKDIDGIHKSIESIQKRQDSHSKKQDEILTLITDFKLEVVKQIGEVASDLKALNSTLKVYDEGARFDKNAKNAKK